MANLLRGSWQRRQQVREEVTGKLVPVEFELPLIIRGFAPYSMPAGCVIVQYVIVCMCVEHSYRVHCATLVRRGTDHRRQRRTTSDQATVAVLVPSRS